MTDRIPNDLFPTFFLGGFECSTHRLPTGRRLDLLASTEHDRYPLQDYRRLMRLGMGTARDGTRWMAIERQSGRYDFSSLQPMVHASLEAGIQVIWDLLHFGWLDHIDVLSEDWPRRFADYAHAVARLLQREGVVVPAFAPVNEISFLAFAGGEAGFFNPFAHGRGDAFKQKLVQASVAACAAIRDVHPEARLVHSDPIIHVVPRPDRPQDRAAAEAHEEAQFHAWDMIAGTRAPELGGRPEYLDILGVNYYVHNQWFYPGGHGSLIPPSHRWHRPLRDLLVNVFDRYQRPMFIAETGIEDDVRPLWLAYVGYESRAALRRGVDLRGICWYPILNHPGWDDDRHCYNGLWDYADRQGRREMFEPLAREIQVQQQAIERFQAGGSEALEPPPLASLDPAAVAIAEVTDRTREGN
jgi:hypothetical protein